MELYSRPISPFAARVRVSIKAKGLDVPLIDHPDVRSADFGVANPLRQVPVLVLDDGRALPESDTIVEYLEDAFPDFSLRPTDLYDRARARLIARTAELYVFPAVLDILYALGLPVSKGPALEPRIDTLNERLAQLSEVIGDNRPSWHAIGRQLSIADGALAPFLFYVNLLGMQVERNVLGEHKPLKRFLDNCREDSSLATVLDEIGAAWGSQHDFSSAHHPADRESGRLRAY